MNRPALLFVVSVTGLVVVVGALAYLYMGGSQEPYSNGDDQNGDGDNGDDPNAGLQLAQDFNLPRVGGGSVQLSDLKDRVVVLDFMSTTCVPCGTQIDILKQIDMQYTSSELTILSLSSSDTESGLSQYMSSKGVTWSFLMDNTGVSQMSGYDVEYIPTIVIINQDGYIAGREVGVTSADDLMAMIDPLT
jgi:cytochrome c biogenesis protein CcmG/thiol:disulfide interchange protein DsbE